MAWLLLHSEYAKHDEKLGRMAAPSLPDVHLEAMEAPEDESEESEETWTPEVACLRSCLFPKSLLALR